MNLRRVVPFIVIAVLCAGGSAAAVALGHALPNHTILFESTRQFRFNTYLLDTGHGLMRPSSPRVTCYQAVWSPDGDFIACRGRGRGGSGFYLVGVPNGAAALLANAGVESGIAWSPNGRHIAYVRAGGQDGIGIIDLYSGTRAHVPAGGFSTRPAWSVEGGRIAFISSEDGLVIAGADGADRAALDVPVNGIAAPAWLPGGAALIFQDGTPGTPQNLVHLDLTTGQTTPLTTGEYNARPVLSPDGAQVAFVRLFDGVYRLAVYDLASGAIRDLSSRANTYTTPAWSPDGAFLVFDSWGAAASGVYLIGVDGTGERRLTDSALDYGPRWRP